MLCFTVWERNMDSFIVSCTTDASLSVGIARATKGDVTPAGENCGKHLFQQKEGDTRSKSRAARSRLVRNRTAAPSRV